MILNLPSKETSAEITSILSFDQGRLFRTFIHIVSWISDNSTIVITDVQELMITTCISAPSKSRLR